MLMSIGSIEQRPRRTALDTVAALRTIQPAAERTDDCVGATIPGFDCFLTHPLVADACASLAQDATLRIIRHHRRQISLSLRVLPFDETLFEVAPVKSQLLQLAFTAAIADRTIKRMIREQKFEHRTLRLFDLFALRGDDHAVGAGDGAGRLQLRHLLDAHETHAAGCLQREVRVITERGNVELVLAADVNQARALRDLKVLAVDGYFD